MLALLRSCNACLRWLLSHALGAAAPGHKAGQAARSAAPALDDMLGLLLDTAALEQQVCPRTRYTLAALSGLPDDEVVR